jgi:hypothetical protein
MFKMHSQDFEKELRKFESDLYERYKKQFDLNVSLYVRISDIVGERERRIELKSDFQRAINFLFLRSYRLHWTIIMMCQKGFGPEASILLRSLMEQVVNMAWIGQEKPDQRAKLFVDYFHVAKKKLYENYDKHGRFPHLTDVEKKLMESREEIEKLYDQVKSNYDDETRWCPNHVRTRAEEVCSSYDWDFYYWYFSFFVHSNAASQLEFVRRLGTQDIYVLGPSDSMMDDVLFLSCKYLLLAFDLWNKAFELGLHGLVQDFSLQLADISFVHEEKEGNKHGQEPGSSCDHPPLVEGESPHN